VAQSRMDIQNPDNGGFFRNKSEPRCRAGGEKYFLNTFNSTQFESSSDSQDEDRLLLLLFVIWHVERG